MADVTVASKSKGPSAPKDDIDSKFYWDGLRRHVLLVQSCTDCRRIRFPPMPCCPFCSSPRFEVVQASGRGRVYSWIVVRRAFDAAFIDQVPYVLATIDLEEGARLVGRIDGEQEVDFGAAVSAIFFDHPDWTELRFKIGG